MHNWNFVDTAPLELCSIELVVKTRHITLRWHSLRNLGAAQLLAHGVLSPSTCGDPHAYPTHG